MIIPPPAGNPLGASIGGKMYETVHLELRKHLKHNLVVNLLDGGFFGFALGFASFVTVIPLFVSTMTNSAVLIGLIPAIHAMGWQLPQLLTADQVSRQKRYKPMVLLMTTQERIPFLGLAIVAWFVPVIGIQAALAITFMLLIWQGLGGGFTATAWQGMIGKIIPSERRGTFFGAQSAAANLMSSLGAVLAGLILENLGSPTDFTLVFLLAGASMSISWVFLSMTREPASRPVSTAATPRDFWKNLGVILKRDHNFRWFVVARMLSQLALMASAFYTVYAVRRHGMSEVTVGVMTGVMLGAQIAVNPILGWIGDRGSHRLAMEIGIAAATASALLAWWAPVASWFYVVFALAGVAYASIWTVGLAMTLEFGNEAERPAYIGLGNTLIAPATILAPFLGGWLADRSGYPAAFLASAAGGLATLVILRLFVRDPRRLLNPNPDPILGD